MSQHLAYLSIGSNLGDKRQNLEAALSLLRSHDEMDVEGVSSFYRTEPQNYTDQDWFVNAAVKIRTGLTPEPLLAALKALEKKLDKDGKPFRFGPRIIDLDIIFYDDLVLKTERLEVPHPRMHERCFVLKPICDIGAQVNHPVLNLRADELLNNLEKQETQKVILLDEENSSEIFY
jgi:2-amino-4-hydroxy-6-hydroxymethyldihydropteridine diphosphokinase